MVRATAELTEAPRISEARAYQRETSRAAARKAVAELQAKGMQYHDIAPAEQVRLRQIATAATEKPVAGYDPATARVYNDELARIRKQPRPRRR